MKALCLLWLLLLLWGPSSAGAWAQTGPTSAKGQPGGPTVPGVQVQTNIEYDPQNGLYLDALTPTGNGPYPAIMFVHGGGWVLGMKADLDFQAKFFAQHGYAGFSINYRLAPSSCYPAPEQDLEHAIAFVRQNAARFHVDPTRVGLLGTSAGGNIVTMEAVAGRGSTGAQVAAVASWSGPFDLLRVWQERPSVPAVGAHVPEEACLSKDASMTDPSTVATLAKASAIDHVRKGFPPTFVANALQELMPLDQAESFYKKLQELGTPTKLFTPPSGHATQYTQLALDPTLSFLDTYLRDYKGAQTGTSSPPSPTPSATAAPSTIAVSPHSAANSSKGPWQAALVVILVLALLTIVALLAGPAIRSRRNHAALRSRRHDNDVR